MEFDRQADEHVEIGSLTVDTGDDPDACIIWLHGLGADSNDFAALPGELMLPASLRVRFVFPDAPVRPVTINGGYMMRAWYDIYEEISEDAPQDEEGIQETCEVMSGLIDQQTASGIPSQRIIMAGFSQGGAVALYTGLMIASPLAGIIALSTYLPLASHFTGSKKIRNRPPVFMAHGESDMVVPYGFGERSYRLLSELGVQVDWNRYPMEHGICADELLALREWMIRVLG